MPTKKVGDDGSESQNHVRSEEGGKERDSRRWSLDLIDGKPSAFYFPSAEVCKTSRDDENDDLDVSSSQMTSLSSKGHGRRV